LTESCIFHPDSGWELVGPSAVTRKRTGMSQVDLGDLQGTHIHAKNCVHCELRSEVCEVNE
jgi:hypothetical protein